MTFLQALVDGASVGMVYVLAAVGFTLVFGVARVLNMAQASMIMVAPFAGIVLMRNGVTAFWAILIGGVAFAGLLSLLIERVALRPFIATVRAGRASDADHLAPLIATLGIVLMAENLVAMEFGTQAIRFNAGLPSGSWQAGSLYVSHKQLFILGLTLAIMAGLGTFIARSKFGLSIRAISQNPGAASLLGINVTRSIAGVVVLAGAVGGAGGVLVAASDNLAHAFMGLDYGIKGLIIIIIGGLGSVRGAVVAGLALGIVESLAAASLGSTFREGAAFGLLVLILLLRPRGLFPAPAVASDFE